jgi:membrane protein DedA with SNARE-associated domain
LSLVSLIAAHGYWILAIGCVLEGEMVLLLAVFAAHRGYLNPAAVIAIAVASAFASNQFFFWLGRRHGTALLERWPALASRSGEIRRLIERHASLAVVAVRFAYGTRVAGPLLIGASSMPQLRFAVLNALSAIAWALLVGAAGWLFGACSGTIRRKPDQSVRPVSSWRSVGRPASKPHPIAARRFQHRPRKGQHRR